MTAQSGKNSLKEIQPPKIFVAVIVIIVCLKHSFVSAKLKEKSQSKTAKIKFL